MLRVLSRDKIATHNLHENRSFLNSIRASTVAKRFYSWQRLRQQKNYIIGLSIRDGLFPKLPNPSVLSIPITHCGLTIQQESQLGTSQVYGYNIFAQQKLLYQKNVALFICYVLFNFRQRKSTYNERCWSRIENGVFSDWKQVLHDSIFRL